MEGLDSRAGYESEWSAKGINARTVNLGMDAVKRPYDVYCKKHKFPNTSARLTRRVWNRHVVYDRFSRGNQRGLWAAVLRKLQERSGIRFEEVIIDSTSLKVHRHGGGQKGGFRRKVSRVRV